MKSEMDHISMDPPLASSYHLVSCLEITIVGGISNRGGPYASLVNYLLMDVMALAAEVGIVGYHVRYLESVCSLQAAFIIIKRANEHHLRMKVVTAHDVDQVANELHPLGILRIMKRRGLAASQDMNPGLPFGQVIQSECRGPSSPTLQMRMVIQCDEILEALLGLGEERQMIDILAASLIGYISLKAQDRFDAMLFAESPKRDGIC